MDFFFPNDYSLIQSFPLNLQELDFRLYSRRTNEDVQLLSPTGGTITNYSDSASIYYQVTEYPGEKESVKYCSAYPNPFTGNTTFSLKVEDQITGTAILSIYNNTGKLLQIITIQVNGPGNNEFRWNGTDAGGNPLKAGMYFYTISLGNMIYSGKIYKIQN